MRTCLHPEGIRSRVLDWPRLATVLLHRLEREMAGRPFDDRLAELWAEARSYPGVAELPTRSRRATGDDLVVPMQIATPSGTLRFVTMIATLGEPFDVTLSELRIETLLPADRATETALREAMP